MMDEVALVPVSALQHYLFCDRQAALIHVSRIWVENAFTVKGKHVHENVDSMVPESRRDIQVRRGISLVCHRLGLVGRADVLELRRASGGVKIPELPGTWALRPVEYKRGKPKYHQADEVQLCAQALCLEEMFATTVPSGDLFYATPRRRTEVVFDPELRRLTEEVTHRMRALLDGGLVPVRTRMKKCRHCSLAEPCMPLSVGTRASPRTYLESALSGDLGV